MRAHRQRRKIMFFIMFLRPSMRFSSFHPLHFCNSFKWKEKMSIRCHKKRYPKLADWLKCKPGWWTEHLKMLATRWYLRKGYCSPAASRSQKSYTWQCAYFFIYSCRSVCPSYSGLADSPANFAHFAVTSEWEPWEMVHGLRPQCQ